MLGLRIRDGQRLPKFGCWGSCGIVRSTVGGSIGSRSGRGSGSSDDAAAASQVLAALNGAYGLREWCKRLSDDGQKEDGRRERSLIERRVSAVVRDGDGAKSSLDLDALFDETVDDKVSKQAEEGNQKRSRY